MDDVHKPDLEDTSSVEAEASEEGVRRFCESRFGISLHWGLYSLNTSGSEWAYYHERIPFETYRKRMDRFNPVRFQAEEWADLMLEAGQKFAMITAKHHDGFCMWDTQNTEFKVTNSVFGRDVVAELATALAARGLGLHFYYSLVDWTHPTYRQDWPAYVEYYQEHLRELCSEYGEIGGFLFDGYWPLADWGNEPDIHVDYFQPRGDFDLAGAYDLIHKLQPNAVITNNHHVLPLRGEDYQVWELDLPGERKHFEWNSTEIGDKPKATWWNTNAGWSYQPYRYSLKSAEDLLATYRAVQSRDAVFMLNVGPRPYGDIHPAEQHVLRQMGQAIG
jgi:alpha-L-fucosidase